MPPTPPAPDTRKSPTEAPSRPTAGLLATGALGGVALGAAAFALIRPGPPPLPARRRAPSAAAPAPPRSDPDSPAPTPRIVSRLRPQTGGAVAAFSFDPPRQVAVRLARPGRPEAPLNETRIPFPRLEVPVPLLPAGEAAALVLAGPDPRRPKRPLIQRLALEGRPPPVTEVRLEGPLAGVTVGAEALWVTGPAGGVRRVPSLAAPLPAAGAVQATQDALLITHGSRLTAHRLSDAARRWTYRPGGEILGPVAAGPGRRLVVTSRHPSRPAPVLHALDRIRGSPLWPAPQTLPAPVAPGCAPALGADRCLVPLAPALLEQRSLAHGGRIGAIDAVVPGRLSAGPVFPRARRLVALGGTGGHVRTLNLRGRRFPAGGPHPPPELRPGEFLRAVAGSPIRRLLFLGEERLAALTDGEFLLLNTHGATLWRQGLPSPPRVGPTLDQGALYLGLEDGTLLVLAARTGERLAAFPGAPLVAGSLAPGATRVAWARRDGRVTWVTAPPTPRLEGAVSGPLAQKEAAPGPSS